MKGLGKLTCPRTKITAPKFNGKPKEIRVHVWLYKLNRCFQKHQWIRKKKSNLA